MNAEQSPIEEEKEEELSQELDKKPTLQISQTFINGKVDKDIPPIIINDPKMFLSAWRKFCEDRYKERKDSFMAEIILTDSSGNQDVFLRMLDGQVVNEKSGQIVPIDTLLHGSSLE